MKKTYEDWPDDWLEIAYDSGIYPKDKELLMQNELRRRKIERFKPTQKQIDDKTKELLSELNPSFKNKIKNK